MAGLLLLHLGTLLAVCATRVASYDLTILHTNDVHARITPSDEKGELVGGVARRKSKVDEIRQAKDNVLLLDAGDQFQGTVWFNIYKGQEAAHFMNMLEYDAESLGNHEFDSGSEVLGPFLDAVKFPVLSCNIDATEDPYLKGKIKPYTIVERSGRKIAIIGYTTEDTVFLSSPSKETVFAPVADALPKTIEEVKAANPDVNIIIAVGHVGYHTDLELAQANPDIDIIVGGHTNTFLYMGEPIQKEVPEGPYPTVIEHADGRKTLVITDYGFGKYLGHLDTTFDDKGELTAWAGNPILLSNKTTDKYNATAEDPVVAAEVAKWEQNVTALMTDNVGSNMLYLMGDRSVCRQRECNLGSLMADANVHFFMKMAEAGSITYKPIMALINGGSVRSDIDVGQVTMGQVMEVIPFQNTIVVVHVPGSKLREALEHGVGSIEIGEGRFPQISGFLFTFDAAAPAGSRVVDVQVPCLTCDYPKLQPLDDAEVYPIITSSYMSEGGDGYEMFADLKRDDFGVLDTDPMVDIFETQSPIHQIEEGRIIRLEGTNSTAPAAAAEPSTSAASACPPAPECPACPSSSDSNSGLMIGIGAALLAWALAATGGAIFLGMRLRKMANGRDPSLESRVTLG